MLADKIKELRDINIKLNVTTSWYQTNMPDYDELLPHLLAINEIHPVGRKRDSEYTDMILSWIVKGRKYADYINDTCAAIDAATRQLNAYILKLEDIAKNHESIYLAIAGIKDFSSLIPALEKLMYANQH